VEIHIGSEQAKGDVHALAILTRTNSTGGRAANGSLRGDLFDLNGEAGGHRKDPALEVVLAIVGLRTTVAILAEFRLNVRSAAVKALRVIHVDDNGASYNNLPVL
jgi:hypothetical protein